MLARTRWVFGCLILVVGFTAAANAQFTKDVTGFEVAEGYADGDEVIWQQPQFSGSTQGIILDSDPPGTPWNISQVVSWVGLPSSSYEIQMLWEDPANTNGLAAVRATTAAGDGNQLPSPSVHLAGKIRFKMAVTAFAWDEQNNTYGAQITSGASVLVCLGIRETGNDVPQGNTDTGGGDIEFVYRPDSTEVPTPNPGSNGIIEWPPKGLRVAATSQAWPPATLDQYEFDLTNVAIRGFANDGTLPNTAGDGMLDATSNGDGVNRGVFEGIYFTNDTADTTGQIFAVYIDDVQFVSPVADPAIPPSINAPVNTCQDTVTVNCQDSASSAKLIVNATTVGVEACVGDPPETDRLATFTSLALSAFDVLTAKQIVETQTSDASSPVVVIPVPSPSIETPVYESDDTVFVICDPTADSATLLQNGVSQGTETCNVSQQATFTGLVLTAGDELTASQEACGDTTDPSVAVIVEKFPAPSVDQPVYDADSTVTVTCDANATQAELFLNGVTAGTAPVAGTTATFSSLALATYDVLDATQVVNGATSALSAPVTVYADTDWKLADDFDAYDDNDQLTGNWPEVFSGTRGETYIPIIAQGGAASCENYLSNQNLTSDAGRRYRFLNGDAFGTDDDPLWFTFWHRHTNNSGSGRTRIILSNYASGDFESGDNAMLDGAVGWEMHNGIAGAYLDEYLTLLVDSGSGYQAGDPDNISNAGYWGSKYNYGLSGVVRSDDEWRKMQIEVRTNTINYYIDGVNVNPPAYASGVPRPNVGEAYRYAVIGLPYSSATMDLQYDSMSVIVGNIAVFGDALPPSPALESPLVPTQTVVTLNDVNSNATKVTVYADDVEIGSVSTTGFESTTVDVAVVALADGANVEGTQTIGGFESCSPTPVTVGVPAPTLIGVGIGDTVVTVYDLHPSATQANVYVNDLLAGSVNTTGVTQVNVTVPALQPADEVEATQFVAGIEGPPSNRVVLVDVVINELVYDRPGGAPEENEFIELYNAGSGPADIGNWRVVNWDEGGVKTTFIIPGGTALAANGYYVIAADTSTLPNVDLPVTSDDLFGPGMDTIDLRNASDAVVDQITYEQNKNQYIPPAEGALWGNHQDQVGFTSLGRYLDGRDTDDNGRDFGTQQQSPGEPNSTGTLSLYKGPDVDALTPGVNAPDYHGSYVIPFVVDPTVAGGGNPRAIPASPQGGNAVMMWDPVGGGNTHGGNFTMGEDSAFDILLYFDPTTTNGLSEQWNIGIAGTADYTFQNSLPLNANGSAGVAWVFFRDGTSASLELVDHGNTGPLSEWVTLGAADLTGMGAGWVRLGIALDGVNVTGTFDDQEITGTTQAGIVGNFFIGYREDTAATPAFLRPPTIDLVETAPTCPGESAGACCPEEDVNGDGQVNGLDIAAISSSANFGKAAVDAADACTDVNRDGQVNGLDVAAASSSACFGQTPPTCP